MAIEERWKRYAHETVFNFSILPKQIQCKGTEITFGPKQFIVLRGDSLKYIYFLISGTALGTRNYEDGNEYNYFLVDSSGGNLGLLELFARKKEYVASILCTTEVKAVRMNAEIIYDYIMENKEMMHRCITLLAEGLYEESGNNGRFYYLDGINRVRHFFVDYYNEHLKGRQKKITVYAEYQDIASTVGISVRTVGRSIRQLKDSGEIQSKAKKVIIDEENYRLLLSSLNV